MQLRNRKKQHYGCEEYKNLPEDEKQKLIEYRKKYYKMRKNTLLYLVLCIKNYLLFPAIIRNYFHLKHLVFFGQAQEIFSSNLKNRFLGSV